MTVDVLHCNECRIVFETDVMLRAEIEYVLAKEGHSAAGLELRDLLEERHQDHE